MKLSKLYDSKEFDPIRENIDVLFINLRPEVEEFQVDLFANYFNNKFRGIYLSKKEIFNIDRKFALFFSQDLSEKTELNHTDYLYLISNENKTLNLQNIYSTHPLLNRQLVNDIIRLR